MNRATAREALASFVLTLVGAKLQVECENLPYFLNAVEFPKRGKVLLGQKRGSTNAQGAFDPEIYEMQLKGNSLSPLVQESSSQPLQCVQFCQSRYQT